MATSAQELPDGATAGVTGGVAKRPAKELSIPLRVPIAFHRELVPRIDGQRLIRTEFNRNIGRRAVTQLHREARISPRPALPV